MPRVPGVTSSIGSSGLTTADYDEIDAVAREHGVGVVAVGNFAMTAALLQRFAVEAAAYLPSWEIIDTASAGKRDAPSGMARELAWRLSQVRPPETEIPVDETVGAVDARGADIDGSRIHSVRLPGYTIGLEVRFGQADERLTIVIRRRTRRRSVHRGHAPRDPSGRVGDGAGARSRPPPLRAR